jgi:RNA polymerase sigma-70 factor (ECF subfamily)
LETEQAVAAAVSEDKIGVDVTATQRIERAFQAHHVAVQRFCVSRLRDQDDAEDAVQEVFARAVRHQDELVGDPLGWLIRAATNVCTDELRRRAHQVAGIEPDDPDETGPAGTDDPETVVVRRMFISDLLRRLTPGERQVVTDTWLLGPGDAERNSMGVQTSTTRVLLCRARRRMRGYLDDFQESASMFIFGFWRPRRTRAGAETWTGVLRFGVPSLVAATVILSGAKPVPATATVGREDIQQAVARPVAAFEAVPANPSPSPTAAAFAIRSGPAVGTGPATSRALALPIPGHQANVQDATITDLEPSPQYSADHTILAAGADRNCPSPPCQSLFVSHDSGHTWTTLPATGFAGTQLLLPPTSFSQGHFFAFGQVGLQETTDGGRTFATSVPDLAGFASTQPAGMGAMFSVSNAARWDFNGGKAPTLGSAFLPGWNAAGPATFLGPGQPSLQPVLHANSAGFDVQVMSCVTTCAAGPVLPWQENTTMVLSPEFASDKTLVAMSGSALAVSLDRGSSFSTVSLPAHQRALSAELTGGVAGPRILAVLASETSTLTVDYSDDLGATWRASQLPAGHGVRSTLARATPTTLIVAMPGSQETQTTFDCSKDAGLSWAAC